MKGSIGLDTGKAYRWREQNLYRNAYNEDRYINELKIRVSSSFLTLVEIIMKIKL